MLLDLIGGRGVEGSTVLDVGGGIGIIDQELLRAGASHAVLADASGANLDIARNEARQGNLLDRIEFVEGDFVQRASEIDRADIVTLDRVVCCYPDARSLVSFSAARAKRLYGLVLPRDRWLVRIGIWLEALLFRLRRSAYRPYAHPNGEIDRLVTEQGLTSVAETGTFLWRVVLYNRT